MNLDENLLSSKEKWIRMMKDKSMELARIEKGKEEQDMLMHKRLKEEIAMHENSKYTGIYDHLSDHADCSSDEEHEYPPCLVKLCGVNCCLETAKYGIPGGTRARCIIHKLSHDEYIKVSRKKLRQIRYPDGYNYSSDEELMANHTIIEVISSESEHGSEDKIYPTLPRTSNLSDSESECDESVCDQKAQRERFIEKLRKSRFRYECPYHLCKARLISETALNDHINRHNGVKPYPCPHEWCDYRGTIKRDIRKHIQSIHSRDGFIRKLKEEYRVIRKLKEWGLNVDTDITIDASRNGCVSDTDRKYSRVDMVVLNVTSCILILEVDEFAHEKPTYNTPCELSRMTDIAAFLRLNSYKQPIFWLRYNPNGKYVVGEKEKKVSRENRENALKEKIFSMMRPDFVPRGNENIHYMFYPRVSESGPPKILENSQFSEHVKNIVSWGE